MKAGFVTDGAGNWFVQVPDTNQWGFSLSDGEVTFAGGFGSGINQWTLIPVEKVPLKVREEMGWILEH